MDQWLLCVLLHWATGYLPCGCYAAGFSIAAGTGVVATVSFGWGPVTTCFADSHDTISSGSRWNRYRLKPSDAGVASASAWCGHSA